jgi:hypothetical protein
MSGEAARPSGVDRFGSRGMAVFVLLCPALLLAGRYAREVTFQHLYQGLLDILPIWLPMFALVWIAALVRLIWPECLPGPLARDSAHMKRAMRLGRGLFWGAAIGLAGAFVTAFAGRDARTGLASSFGIMSCVCLSAGLAVQAYATFRREPGTSAAAGPERLFLLPVIPVLLLFVGTIVIASWGEWGWTLGTGALFAVLLLLFVSQLKQERVRRRGLKESREDHGTYLSRV